ncbi:uncharacterized protein LOC114467494 [Gouania willdenowi]|uniref:uncharacterized protein LOC114467494 n=1 Tax=Gouania willdenowi TaxID=441366 RepID=UPI001054A035|nr:uncharacterized protein LOC114467494 [Gouania willdenowi]
MNNTLKMRSVFVFIFLLDVSPLKGQQQRIEESENILLRFYFPSFYNSYMKFCCKLYPGGCYKLLDNEGYTCDQLKGRVTRTEQDGCVEFKIWNVRSSDGGFYRCLVLGPQNPIFHDYYVEVFESSHDHRKSQPFLTSTTTFPVSTRPVQAQDQSFGPRISWSFVLPLAVIMSTTVMIFITSVIGVIYCRLKAKRQDKHGDTLSESLRRDGPETSAGVVYTTVDFKARPKQPEEMYANLRTHKGHSEAETTGMVEYSTLALQ